MGKVKKNIHVYADQLEKKLDLSDASLMQILDVMASNATSLHILIVESSNSKKQKRVLKEGWNKICRGDVDPLVEKKHTYMPRKKQNFILHMRILPPRIMFESQTLLLLMKRD